MIPWPKWSPPPGNGLATGAAATGFAPPSEAFCKLLLVILIGGGAFWALRKGTAWLSKRRKSVDPIQKNRPRGQTP